MISGESAPGFLIHLPLKACRLFDQIHASQSALDAQITHEGVSRNRNVDSILEKTENFFTRPPAPAILEVQLSRTTSQTPIIISIIPTIPIPASKK